MVEPVEWILRQARIDDDGPLVDIALNAGAIVAIGERLPQHGQQGGISLAASCCLA